MVQLFYTTYISVDIAHHEIFHAKVGKGGIISSLSHQGLISTANHNYCYLRDKRNNKEIMNQN